MHWQYTLKVWNSGLAWLVKPEKVIICSAFFKVLYNIAINFNKVDLLWTFLMLRMIPMHLDTFDFYYSDLSMSQ